MIVVARLPDKNGAIRRVIIIGERGLRIAEKKVEKIDTFAEWKRAIKKENEEMGYSEELEISKLYKYKKELYDMYVQSFN